MLVLQNALIDKPVLSLRTGSPVATTRQEIFNPNNLKIEGLYCDDKFRKAQSVLVTQDIRELSTKGFIVNDHEVLADPEDLVRFEKLFEINFVLLGKSVFTEDNTKVGKVEDYAIDNKSLFVQKLYVSRSMLKSLGAGQLSVDRNDIIEVTDKKIIIKDILRPTKVPAAATI